MTEQTIFLAALDIADPAERAAYLADACGTDVALRRQVETLLAAHERSGAFLDDPAVEQMAAHPVPTDETVTAGAPAAGDHELGFLGPPTRAGSLGRLGHYEVLEVLGRGAFGTVLRAFDDRLHRVVAIKVLSPQLAHTGTARARFVREARAGAAVRDEHVVNIYAVEGDEPVPYLVMECVAGQTLQQKLDRTGPLSVPEVLRIGSQIARGLAAAHATGLIHRDIKPSNVLLENGVERVKITDFGLARAADDASLTHSGAVAGTPLYMAPEQARGEKVDPRGDLFSLGSVLYAMCTGRPPFRASTTMGVLKRVTDDDPRPIGEINSEVPDWLTAVIAKLHAKDPADRFQTAEEVADRLARYQSELQSTGTVFDAGRAELGPSPAVDDSERIESSGVLSWVVWTAILTFAVTVAAVLIAGFTNRPSAARGTLVLEELDPGLQVQIRQGDTIVHERSVRHEFDLPVHNHTVLVAYRAGTETELFRTDFAIKPDQQTVINVRRELAAVEEQNRAAIDGNKLKELAKAVHNVGTTADGFVPLFNGKNLDGWHPHPLQPGRWRVEDGVLIGRGATSHLMSDRNDYRDFHLRATARINPGGDSGVCFRCSEELRRGMPLGYEAEIIDSHFRDTSPTGSLIGNPPRVEHKALLLLRSAERNLTAPDRWFKLEVIARGNRLTARVDGTDVATVEDAEFRRGHLALQVNDEDTVVQFQSVEIKELPSPDGKE